uniref:Uncharacterized protein n=1 Tax=Vibrio splendidus TaxID=29497 RepID=A0A0H3ZNI5_VIBSP|nr:hypothetical protein [Vibrio splendidus]
MNKQPGRAALAQLARKGGGLSAVDGRETGAGADIKNRQGSKRVFEKAVPFLIR